MTDLSDRRAAAQALERATARLEQASAAVRRWQRGNGEWAWTHLTKTRLLREWEKAWEDYKLALVVAAALVPRRLRRWQRTLAGLVGARLK